MSSLYQPVCPRGVRTHNFVQSHAAYFGQPTVPCEFKPSKHRKIQVKKPSKKTPKTARRH
jgi:hypothetical protein